MKSLGSRLTMLQALMAAVTFSAGATSRWAAEVTADEILVTVGGTVLHGDKDPITGKFTGKPLQFNEAPGFGEVISDGFLFPQVAGRVLVPIELFLVELAAGQGCPEPALMKVARCLVQRVIEYDFCLTGFSPVSSSLAH
jgi:hypothetical protein